MFDVKSFDEGYWTGVKIAKDTAKQSVNIDEFLKKFDEETRLVRC